MNIGRNTNEISRNYIKLYSVGSEIECHQFLKQWLSEDNVTKEGILTTINYYFQKNNNKSIIKFTKNLLKKL
jgi:hypothetical protein